MLPATEDRYELAEGPLWDAARGRLLWVDIFGRAVLEGRLHDDGTITVVRRHDFESMVGAVVAADDGSLLVAAQDQLVVQRADGSRAVIARVVPEGARRRMNDGAVDPGGRFLVGTAALDGPSDREELVRLEQDGTLTVIDRDLTLSNGLAWSVDGRRMFTVDTHRQTIFVRDYDAATGSTGPRAVHVTVEGGSPDGIAMDADDHLWLAVWGAGEVRRHAPDGRLVASIAVPAPHTSSVAFAGDDLRTLVITTALDGLSEEERGASPGSGRLFTLRTEVPGARLAPWVPPSPPARSREGLVARLRARLGGGGAQPVTG